jgi:large subunit ribosomal protein L30
MAELKITLIKSPIGCLKAQKDTIKALGLIKIGHSNILPDTAVTQGMIKVVSHMVTVEKV